MPKRVRSYRRLLIFFNVISCLMLLVFALIIFQQAKKNEHYDDWVIHSYEVVRTAHRIVNNAFETESAYRGYFLTGSGQFLHQVPLLETAINMDLGRLEKLLANNQDQQENLANIKTQFEHFKNMQDRQREIYVIGGASGLLVNDIQESQRLMNNLQQDLEKFISTELTHLQRRIATGKQEQIYHVSTIIIGTAISIIGLVVANALIVLLMSFGTSTARRLQDIEQLYGLVMQSMSDGLFDYDPVTKQIVYSSTYRQQLGYTVEELPDSVEKSFNQILHPDDFERVWAETRDYMERKIPVYSIAYRLRHKDGRWLWILARGVGTWDKDGKIIRLVGIHTDITAQKKTEEELRELNSEMETFTYIASHDLRSPLVNLKGFTKELENSLSEVKSGIQKAIAELPEPEQKKFRQALDVDIPESIDFIKNAIERMDMLTGAILNLSRIGRRVYKPTLVDMTDLITRYVQSQNYELSRNNTKIDIQPLPQVYADQLALEQIFGNVIDNAIKYLDPSRAGEIKVYSVENPTEHVFVVQDNGRGITANEHSKVFDLFRRARNAGNVRGAGMGLTFVKTAVRKMGGRIWYESQLDHGTMFYITLPKNSIAQG